LLVFTRPPGRVNLKEREMTEPKDSIVIDAGWIRRALILAQQRANEWLRAQLKETERHKSVNMG